MTGKLRPKGGNARVFSLKIMWKSINRGGTQTGIVVVTKIR